MRRNGQYARNSHEIRRLICRNNRPTQTLKRKRLSELITTNTTQNNRATRKFPNAQIPPHQLITKTKNKYKTRKTNNYNAKNTHLNNKLQKPTRNNSGNVTNGDSKIDNVLGNLSSGEVEPRFRDAFQKDKDQLAKRTRKDKAPQQ